MSDDAKAKGTLSDDDIATEPVGRRSAIGMLGAGAIGLALSGCYRGMRGGCTDSDPVDRAGMGRRCGGGGYRTCSDSDPVDPAGRGRHC